MTYQYDDPNQIVYALYRVNDTGDEIPETWYETIEELNKALINLAALSGNVVRVYEQTRREFTDRKNVYR